MLARSWRECSAKFDYDDDKKEILLASWHSDDEELAARDDGGRRAAQHGYEQQVGAARNISLLDFLLISLSLLVLRGVAVERGSLNLACGRVVSVRLSVPRYLHMTTGDASTQEGAYGSRDDDDDEPATLAKPTSGAWIQLSKARKKTSPKGDWPARCRPPTATEQDALTL